jgi:hypothetical protein
MNELVTSDEQFIAARDFLRASIAALMPDLDFGNGTALNDLVIAPAAKLAAEERIREANYYQTYNPASVTVDTPVEVVAAILSRYFIDPAAGNKASGVIKVFTNTKATQIVPTGSTFVSGGMSFLTLSNIRVVASASLVKTSQDVVYTESSNGFYFLVPVKAEFEGDAYNVHRGAVFDIPSSYTSIVAITAYSDFSGGSTAETPVEAVGRIPERFGARTTGMSSSLVKLVQDQFGISDVVSVYSPDSALLRAARNSVGLPVGGFCDLYVRSTARAEKFSVNVTGYLLDPALNLWRLPLPEEYNGVYQVKVNNVVAIINSVTAPSSNNTIVNPQDAVFTSRQSVEALTYSADDTSALPIDTQRVFDVELTRMPLVKEISDYLADASRRSGVDLLVRAVCPVFITTSFTVLRKVSDPVPDVAALKAKIISAVSELGIGVNNLDGSIIIGVVQASLGQRSYVSSDSFTLEAHVLDHKLATSNIVGAKSISIAERPEDGITKDTVGFIVREEDISISVVDYQ